MAAMKPRTGHGPLEATKEGRGIVMRVPLEGGGRLVVETDLAGRHQRAEFRREWVRVEPRAGDTSLIEVSGQGRSVKVGRYVRPELRQALAHEIRKALRQA